MNRFQLLLIALITFTCASCSFYYPKYFMNVWKNELNKVQANYTIVSGLENQRLENGLNTVKAFLMNY